MALQPSLRGALFCLAFLSLILSAYYALNTFSQYDWSVQPRSYHARAQIQRGVAVENMPKLLPILPFASNDTQLGVFPLHIDPYGIRVFQNVCVGTYTWFMVHTLDPQNVSKCKALLDRHHDPDPFCDSFPRRMRPKILNDWSKLPRRHINWAGTTWVHDLWVNSQHIGHWAYRLVSFWAAMNRNVSQFPPVDQMFFVRQDSKLNDWVKQSRACSDISRRDCFSM